jgi:hypothetical protein
MKARIFTLSLLIATLGIAQKNGTFSSVEFKNKFEFHWNLSTMVRSGNNYFIFDRQNNTLTQLDIDLKKTKQVKLPKTKTDKLERKYSVLVCLGGKILISFYTCKSGSSQVTCYLQSIDPSSLTLSEDIVKVGDFSFINSMQFEEYFMLPVYSPDSSLVCIYHLSNWNNSNKPKCTIDAFVVNSGLQTKWSKQIVIGDMASNVFFVKNAIIDNNGDLFCTGVQYSKPVEMNMGPDLKAKLHSRAFGYLFSNAKGEIEYPLKGKGTINTAFLSVSKDENLVISGLYTNIDDPISAKGSFYLKFEKVGTSALFSSFDDLTSEEVNLVSNNDQQNTSGKNGEVFGITVNEMLTTPSGQCILLAEQETFSVSSNGIIFYCNNILVINYSPDGKIKWKRVVPKKQISSHPAKVHYLACLNNEDIIFSFNDNNANVTTLTSKPVEMMVVDGPGLLLQPKSTKSVVFVKISADGGVAKETLLGYKEDDCLLEWYQLFRIRNGQYFMLSESSKVPFKVTFK